MKKVLFADDSEVARLEAKSQLESAGFTVLEAGSGTDALNIAMKNTDLCAVIVDYNMPGKNGVDTIAALRQLPFGTDVPALILSAQFAPNFRELSQQHKISGWAMKPAKWEVIISTLNKLVESHEQKKAAQG